MTPGSLMRDLPSPTGSAQVIEKHQDVDDIIREVMDAHRAFEPDYDRIAGRFTGENIPHQLYDFCRKNLAYEVESEKLQTTRSPSVLLKMGHCDCKGYAGFIAGVLDALNRSGRGKYPWAYRFARYESNEDSPGHVFVVLKNSNGETWIDPVLSAYDKRNPVPIDYTDRGTARMVSIKGTAGCCSPLVGYAGSRIGTAEDDLLSALKQYEQGLIQNIATARQNGGLLDPVTLGVLQNAIKSVPGAAQAYAFAQTYAAAITQLSGGPGSLASRVVTAAFSGNVLTTPINVLKAVLNGRTYQSDNYWGAVFYRYYVLGESNITDPNKVTDSDVITGLKWFIDKTGVFISGREHIHALQQSAQAYLNLHSVNSDTTTDPARVNAAVQVVKTYMPVDNIPIVPAGSWAGTVGVYDQELVNLVSGSQQYYNELMAAKQQATQSLTNAVNNAGSLQLPGIVDELKAYAQANPMTTVAIVGVAALLLYEIFKD